MKVPLFRQCAEMFMVGFPGLTPTPDFESLVKSGIYGAVLFKRNIESIEQTAELCSKIKRDAGRPFLIAVDQEGGRVARLRGPPLIEIPPMRVIGASGDADLAHRVGELIAFELSAIGFDWNFAPVLDVDTHPDNPVIGDRSFHSKSEEVARLGLAMAKGLEAGGIASCGKHFPGHGDTTQDSHRVLPRLPHTLERLRSIELLPFRAYAANQLAALMTAHIIFEAVDSKMPATMSLRVLDGILRREMGFEGLIVSDDLEMKAISDNHSLEEVVVQGAIAGVDLFLICHHAEVQSRAIEILVQAVEKGEVKPDRIRSAANRRNALLSKFYHPPQSRAWARMLGSAEHLDLGRDLPSGNQGSDPTEFIKA